jgi:t-SNARE complex subunit (syntaxin)
MSSAGMEATEEELQEFIDEEDEQAIADDNLA